MLRWNSHPVPRAAGAKVKRPIAHEPASQGIESGTIESADREESPEPPAPRYGTVGSINLASAVEAGGGGATPEIFSDAEPYGEACWNFQYLDTLA